MEDEVKAHDHERKRIVRSKPETRAHQNAPSTGASSSSSVNRLSTLTMTILNTRNVFKLLLFTLPPVLVLSRILLICPLKDTFNLRPLRTESFPEGSNACAEQNPISSEENDESHIGDNDYDDPFVIPLQPRRSVIKLNTNIDAGLALALVKTKCLCQ
ncbi:hypothetical protein CDAR_118811 [Caerostris darwini]|uniref:Uncharacterized protein n=1 Tax=Caerostris darwini TaxID=1538125 RepID=A0AAV4TSW2_9ARAC|nr:hypothetical protein CDAR_118811 [Caerostris darwini]